MIMLPVSSWREYFSMHASESMDCKFPTDVLPSGHERVTETPLMNWASTRIIFMGRSPSSMAFEALGFAKLGTYKVQSNKRHNHMMKLADVLEDFAVHNNFPNFS